MAAFCNPRDHSPTALQPHSPAPASSIIPISKGGPGVGAVLVPHGVRGHCQAAGTAVL